MYYDLLEDIFEYNTEYNNKAYSDILSRKINEIKNLDINLIDKINTNKKKQNRFISFIQKTSIAHLGGISLTAHLTNLIFNLHTLIVLLSSIACYIIFIITNLKKYKWKDKMLKKRSETLKNICNYLETEQEITKNMEYLLPPNIIQYLDAFIKKDIKTASSFRSYKSSNLQLINNRYIKGYNKNLLIIATINNLEDEQKQRYLENIYNAIDDNEIYSDEIMKNIINKKRETMSNLLVLPTKNKTSADNITESLDNIPLEHISTKLSINKDDEQQVNINYSNTSESSSESINATAPNPNKPVKPVSLKKEDYGLPYYDENGVLCINGDPMPPMFQKEKGHQFSKKFPN